MKQTIHYIKILRKLLPVTGRFAQKPVPHGTFTPFDKIGSSRIDQHDCVSWEEKE